jgi:BsuBI/PstI restriction endonuclease domain/BsuBI/PstI restriction endonuclease HTH domain
MPDTGAGSAVELPGLIGVEAVRERLAAIFPQAFPDRGILVGKMAAHVVFVFLYGGFIEGSGRFLRPSLVYFFTAEQARRVKRTQRLDWLAAAFKPGHRPAGKRWYADTSRESIRDDLMRNRLLAMGMLGRKEGVPTNSSKPVFFLRSTFAALFNPALSGAALQAAIEAWRREHLDSGTLKRMALKASGVLEQHGDVFIEMPDGTRMRVAAGPSAPILKAMVEQFAPRWLRKPVVLWISASDQKTHPLFVQRARSVGLEFDPSNELPDLILADVDNPVRFVFCEIVATDSPVTAERKASLTRIAAASGIDARHLLFVTAFQDREAAAFRKTFSRIAPDSEVWFSTEPDLIVELRSAPRLR